MNIARVIALSKKEFLHITRDKRTLFVVFALPVLMLLLYGYALTFDIRNIPFVVTDMDNTPLSRELTGKFSSSRYFRFVGHAADFREQQSYLLSGKAAMAVTINNGFASKVLSGKGDQVLISIEGSDANTATVANGYVNAIIQGFSVKVISKIMRAGTEDILPVVTKPRVLYNPELRSMHFLIPGLIALLLMIIAAMIISMTIVGEKTKGTMEQLIVTSIKPHEIMLGKMVPYVFIGIGDVVLCVATGVFVFGMTIRGDLLLLFGESLIFIFGAMSMGILISTVASRQEDALLMSSLTTFLPSMLLSGFVFPISSMPWAIQLITYFVPARYFINILRGIILKGVGLDVLWPDTLLLIAFAAIMLTASSRKFRRTVQ